MTAAPRKSSSSTPSSIPMARIVADDSLAWKKKTKQFEVCIIVKTCMGVGREVVRACAPLVCDTSKVPRWCARWHDQNAVLKMQKSHRDDWDNRTPSNNTNWETKTKEETEQEEYRASSKEICIHHWTNDALTGIQPSSLLTGEDVRCD